MVAIEPLKEPMEIPHRMVPKNVSENCPRAIPKDGTVLLEFPVIFRENSWDVSIARLDLKGWILL